MKFVLVRKNDDSYSMILYYDYNINSVAVWLPGPSHPANSYEGARCGGVLLCALRMVSANQETSGARSSCLLHVGGQGTA